MWYVAGFFLVTVITGLYAWLAEPRRVQVSEYTVQVPSLHKKVVVLFISDIHLGKLTPLPAVQRIVASLANERPDLVLLGGDFIDTEAAYLAELPTVLHLLRRWGAPVLGVPGNHDFNSLGKDVSGLAEVFREAGAVLLRNQAEVVGVAGQKIVVVGIDDLQKLPPYGNGETYMSLTDYQKQARKVMAYTAFDNFMPEEPRILMAHNPDVVYLPGHQPNLVLAGHTHGGMVFLLDWLSRPFWHGFWWFLPPGSFATRAGKMEVNNRLLLVSRGIGSSGLPLRLGRRPEVIRIILHA